MKPQEGLLEGTAAGLSHAGNPCTTSGAVLGPVPPWEPFCCFPWQNPGQ